MQESIISFISVMKYIKKYTALFNNEGNMKKLFILCIGLNKSRHITIDCSKSEQVIAKNKSGAR